MIQALRQMRAETVKVFADKRNLGKPSVNIHAQQRVELCGGDVQAVGIEIGRPWKPSNRCFQSMSLALATLEDPFQHPAVLAVARPEKLAVFVGAEPVHVKDLRKFCSLPLSDPKIVREVIAHVVAAERKHGHGIAAKLSNLARGGRGGLAARG